MTQAGPIEIVYDAGRKTAYMKRGDEEQTFSAVQKIRNHSSNLIAYFTTDEGDDGPVDPGKNYTFHGERVGVEIQDM
jgi:hypothetical protein